MEGVTFRPARIDEVDRLSDIVNDPPSAGSLKIAGSVDKAIRGGRVLSRRGLTIQVEHATVAELAGDVIGVMDANSSRTESDVSPTLILRLLVPVISVVGVGGLWRLIRSRAAWSRVSFAQLPSSFYIAELDIDQIYRNRGIGAAFLKLAEERARSEGCDTMSLVTGIENPAQHLYERVGFRIVETKRDVEYERWSDSPGRVMMLKELS